MDSVKIGFSSVADCEGRGPSSVQGGRLSVRGGGSICTTTEYRLVSCSFPLNLLSTANNPLSTRSFVIRTIVSLEQSQSLLSVSIEGKHSPVSFAYEQSHIYRACAGTGIPRNFSRDGTTINEPLSYFIGNKNAASRRRKFCVHVSHHGGANPLPRSSRNGT